MCFPKMILSSNPTLTGVRIPIFLCVFLLVCKSGAFVTKGTTDTTSLASPEYITLYNLPLPRFCTLEHRTPTY